MNWTYRGRNQMANDDGYGCDLSSLCPPFNDRARALLEHAVEEAIATEVSRGSCIESTSYDPVAKRIHMTLSLDPLTVSELIVSGQARIEDGKLVWNV